MNNFINKIKYFVFAFKEKSLKNKLEHSMKKSYSNKSTKQVFSKAADLTLNSETLKLIEQVKQEVTTIVKKTNAEPNLLLDYVKMGKTKVCYLPYADKFLNIIKEDEGIIYEKQGFEAFYLALITGQGIKFKTQPMFVLRNGVIDKFYMLHNFYRWYSLKSNLAGFDYSVQKLFKRFLFDESQTFVKSLSMAQIISLKEAIARDNEATAFVLEYTKEVDGSKKVLDKIKNEGGANI
jgi:hypothetical protein